MAANDTAAELLLLFVTGMAVEDDEAVDASGSMPLPNDDEKLVRLSGGGTAGLSRLEGGKSKEMSLLAASLDLGVFLWSVGERGGGGLLPGSGGGAPR